MSSVPPPRLPRAGACTGGMRQMPCSVPTGREAPADAARPAVDLVPAWTADGFSLPVRIPYHFVIVERRWASGKVLQSDALDGQAQPFPSDTCLPAYRNRDVESVVTGMVIRMWLSSAQRMGLAAYARPAE